MTLRDLHGHSLCAGLVKKRFLVQLCSSWQNFKLHSASRGSSASLYFAVCPFHNRFNFLLFFRLDWERIVLLHFVHSFSSLLGRQPTGDSYHKPSSRLQLLSARPAVCQLQNVTVTGQYQFILLVEQTHVWTTCLGSLHDSGRASDRTLQALDH